jgi:hypothetical protein
MNQKTIFDNEFENDMRTKRGNAALNVCEVLKLLLELDDQIVAPRPSLPLRAAAAVKALAEDAVSRATRQPEGAQSLAVLNCDWRRINTSLNRHRGDRTGW